MRVNKTKNQVKNDPARLMVNALKEMGCTVGIAQARKVVEKLDKARNAVAPAPLIGPENADLYEGIVTLDVPMSAVVRVHARSVREANDLLLTAAYAQYPRGFELDEGNTVDASDFYLGDKDATANLSEPTFLDAGSLSGEATWEEENFYYKITMTRNAPDSTVEAVWCKVTTVLMVSDKHGNKVRKTVKGIEDYQGNPAERIARCLLNGDLDSDLDALALSLRQMTTARK